MGRLSKDAWNEIIARYQNGELAGELAKEFGCSGRAVGAMLERRRIEKHDPSFVYRTASGHSINDRAFNEITPDAAYWIGFLMADGTVTTGNTVAIVLSEIDAPHLERFRDFLSASNKVIFGVNAGFCRKTRACRFAFRSSSVCKALAQYGVVANKTHTASVSEALARNRDFWRGVVDGDGHIAVNHKPSYFNRHPKVNAWSKPRTVARLDLVGSEQLLKQFSAFVASIVPRANISVRPHKSIYVIGLGGGTAESVIRALYDGASTALERKMSAARNILAFATAGNSAERHARGGWMIPSAEAHMSPRNAGTR